MTIFLLGTSYAQENGCPAGYQLLGQVCYVYVELQENWIEAQEYCKVLGAHLVEPKNLQENMFVKGLMLDHAMSHTWLGGEDLTQEGKWMWSSTNTPVEEYTDWSPHEPNNLHQEDCMEIRSSDGKWNDSRCDSKYAFICQKAISTDVIG